jgi:adenine-specific DNA glycosylase
MKKPENMEIKLLNIPAPLMEWYYSHARILPWRSPEP